MECYELTAEGIRNKFPRLEETIQSAGKCNYRRIGMAFCVGLKQEATCPIPRWTHRGSKPGPMD